MATEFAFSYSRWSAWSECPAKYRYKHVDKLPEPKSAAMAKGIAAHQAAADYVSGKTDVLPPALRHYSRLAGEMRAVPEDHKFVEAQFAFDQDHQRCDWFGPNAAWRFIWDVGIVNGAKTQVNAVDFKTGSPRGSYDAQMQIFAIPAYWMFPKLENFLGHLAYLDTGDTVTVSYDRGVFYGPSGDPAKREGLHGYWMNNVAMMRNDRAFVATPSRDACKFCHYSDRRGGPCHDRF